MLHSATELIGYKIIAYGVNAGKVYDFLFDDAEWSIRYLVLNIMPWPMKRLVSISPTSIQQPDHANCLIPVSLTKDQIKSSPRVEVYRSVYRYQQVDSYIFPLPLGMGMGGALLVHRRGVPPTYEDDPHVRSTKEVIAYHIIATDGEIGYVDDFIADDHGWIISCLAAVHIQNSSSMRKAMIMPQTIKEIRWKEERIYVSLLREDIDKSFKYHPAGQLNHGDLSRKPGALKR